MQSDDSAVRRFVFPDANVVPTQFYDSLLTCWQRVLYEQPINRSEAFDNCFSHEASGWSDHVKSLVASAEPSPDEPSPPALRAAQQFLLHGSRQPFRELRLPPFVERAPRLRAAEFSL